MASYSYTDADGRLLYQVVRREPKDFRQRRPDGKGGWDWNLKGVCRVLYKLPDLLNTPTDRPVFVVEGEKDADRLGSLGLVATTCAMGAGKWSEEYNEPLRGREVFIIADNDEAGREHAREVEKNLRGVAASVAVIELPGLPEKGDATDWLDANNNDAVKLLETIEELARHQENLTAAETKPSPAATAPSWPDPPAPEAYHGLAGNIVRKIEPHSEADPAALLIQTLVAFGNAVGRTAHFVAEDDEHYCNEFVNLIGATSKGRKGSSWGRVRRQYEAVDPEWAERIEGGLSSGEGLIWAVRDPIFTHQPVRERGRVTGRQEVETDPGVSDKRLLVYEAEFAGVLKHIERQGNTLSPILRQAWETGSLKSMTKNNPAKATGAHVSIIGHCTMEELRRLLSCTEIASGFGNRFLWVLVRRSKALPEGGRLHDDDMQELRARLKDALTFARTVGEMRRDDGARSAWRSVYGQLSEGKPGLAGSLLGRAEAHVMRLACIYALMDLSAVVRQEHLFAALGLWDYAEASVNYIFGKSLGDPLADEILRLLKAAKGGKTRTDINHDFGRHKSSEQIGRAIGLLVEKGLARSETAETDGRPAERWFAVEG